MSRRWPRGLVATYARLGRWKCDVALVRPADSTGSRVVARVRP